eukprot:TRINITY_DN43_c0_g1_i1.p1 TRINITY_DN43_c0_g1~~TRINITY_DN43_c0_g1_i1.p1  ORF type:complete len:156 (-),score=6.31 TRINITY_DN43_c0_g1_i1:152-619(-)
MADKEQVNNYVKIIRLISILLIVPIFLIILAYILIPFTTCKGSNGIEPIYNNDCKSICKNYCSYTGLECEYVQYCPNYNPDSLTCLDECDYKETFSMIYLYNPLLCLSILIIIILIIVNYCFVYTFYHKLRYVESGEWGLYIDKNSNYQQLPENT